MERIRLKRELSLSRVIQGCWRIVDWDITTEDLLSHVEKLISLGVTTFDHADIYGNYQCQKIFGKIFDIKPELRNKMEIITKLGIKLATDKFPKRIINHYDTSYSYILESVENSLEELNTTYIDLLLIHRPDFLTDPEEVASAFRKLKREGKVRSFGVSNFKREEMELIESFLDEPLVTNQLEVSLTNTENLNDGTLSFMLKEGINPMVWSPLSGGDIFDKEKYSKLHKELNKIKEEVEAKDISEVIYSWLFKLPNEPTIVVGTQNIERVKSAINAIGIKLTNEQWYRILTTAEGHGVA